MPRVEVVEQDGARIRALRIEQGIRLTDLADRIHRHAKTLGHIERETRCASAVLINQIARALEVDPAEITKDPADAEDDTEDEVAA